PELSNSIRAVNSEDSQWTSRENESPLKPSVMTTGNSSPMGWKLVAMFVVSTCWSFHFTDTCMFRDRSWMSFNHHVRDSNDASCDAGPKPDEKMSPLSP